MSDEIVEIQTPEEQAPAAEPAELSLRDEIKTALENAKAEPREKTEEPTEVKSARTRDTTGKFAKTAENSVDSKPEPVEGAKDLNAPPQAWSAESRSKWNALAPEIRAEILKREDDVHKGFSKLDTERNTGKQFSDVVTPYLPMIQAEGGNPIAAVKDLLHTAYVLRTATPAQKGALLHQIAKQYGADLGFAPQQNSPTGQPADNDTRHLVNKIAQIEQNIYQREAYERQQQESALDQHISAFASDPKHVHFEQVRQEMGALIGNGSAKNMEEAYEMAVWAKPDIRSTLLDAQIAEREAKKVADIKQRSEAARKASASINGGPGISVPNIGATDRSLRDELLANYRAFSN